MGEETTAEGWIFNFRRTHQREITEDEAATLRRRLGGYRMRALLWTILSVLSGIAALLGIAVAANPSPWGWVMLVAGVVALFWCLNIANRNDRLRLLFRRTLRKKTLDVYLRSERAVDFIHIPAQADEDDEEWPERVDDSWERDEKFEEQLAKEIGRDAAYFETPAGDTVVVAVEEKIVRRVIEAPLLGPRVSTRKEPPK